jgi:hypothetical protein
MQPLDNLFACMYFSNIGLVLLRGNSVKVAAGSERPDHSWLGLGAAPNYGKSRLAMAPQRWNHKMQDPKEYSCSPNQRTREIRKCLPPLILLT